MKDIFGKVVILIVIFVVFLMVSPLISNKFSLSSKEELVVKPGDSIKVEYTGTLEDGTKFDSSVGRDPLEFIAGTGQTIPGFDRAVIGMKLGEEKDIKIQPQDAYGEINLEGIQDIPRDQIGSDRDVEVGMLISLSSGDGQEVPARITRVTDELITVDLNHQLAGQVLNFKIKILEIVS